MEAASPPASASEAFATSAPADMITHKDNRQRVEFCLFLAFVVQNTAVLILYCGAKTELVIIDYCLFSSIYIGVGV